MEVLILIISVITYLLSIAIVVLSKKNKYRWQDFASHGFLMLLWFRWIVNTNYFDRIRKAWMALLHLIIIIVLKTILQQLYAMLWITISTENSECSNDTWKTLNSLIRCKTMSKDVILNRNGPSVSGPSLIAELFYSYFSNAASNLDRNILHSNISQ